MNIEMNGFMQSISQMYSLKNNSEAISKLEKKYPYAFKKAEVSAKDRAQQDKITTGNSAKIPKTCYNITKRKRKGD